MIDGATHDREGGKKGVAQAGVRTLAPVCCGLLVQAACLANAASSLNAVFTYQGCLSEGASVANGLYELRFGLCDAAVGGAALALTTNAPLAVSNGLFTAAVDFGFSPFDGGARWLEIGVRPQGSAAPFTPLSPRQALTAVPHALYAPTAGTARSFSGSVSESQLPATIPRLNSNLTFSGSVEFAGAANRFVGTFSGNGAGLTNLGGSTAAGRGAFPPAVGDQVLFYEDFDALPDGPLNTNGFSGFNLKSRSGNTLWFWGPGMTNLAASNGFLVPFITDSPYVYTNTASIGWWGWTDLTNSSWMPVIQGIRYKMLRGTNTEPNGAWSGINMHQGENVNHATNYPAQIWSLHNSFHVGNLMPVGSPWTMDGFGLEFETNGFPLGFWINRALFPRQLVGDGLGGFGLNDTNGSVHTLESGYLGRGFFMFRADGWMTNVFSDQPILSGLWPSTNLAWEVLQKQLSDVVITNEGGAQYFPGAYNIVAVDAIWARTATAADWLTEPSVAAVQPEGAYDRVYSIDATVAPGVSTNVCNFKLDVGQSAVIEAEFVAYGADRSTNVNYYQYSVLITRQADGTMAQPLTQPMKVFESMPSAALVITNNGWAAYSNTPVAIDPATDKVVLPGHGLVPRDVIRVSGSPLPGGLAEDVDYGVYFCTSNRFALQWCCYQPAPLGSFDLPDAGNGVAITGRGCQAIIAITGDSSLTTKWRGSVKVLLR
jgi:hypothetical protein